VVGGLADRMICPRVTLGILLVVVLYGCVPGTFRSVTTYEEWVKRHIEIQSGQDRRHLVFHINTEAIKNDYVRFLNEFYMKKVHLGDTPADPSQWRIDRMVWREMDVLHVENISTLMLIEPDKLIDQWEQGFEKVRRGTHGDPIEQAAWEFPMLFFEKVIVHSGKKADFYTWEYTETELNNSYGDGRDEFTPRSRKRQTQ